VPFTDVFPLGALIRTIAVAAVPAAIAVVFKMYADMPVGIMLLMEAVIVLGGFALAGHVFRLIGPDEWRFAKEFVQLKLFRRGAV
jgi:hypothetical protein